MTKTWILWLGMGLSAAAQAKVTDIFLLRPKDTHQGPMVRVIDDQDGVSTHRLAERFDLPGEGGQPCPSVANWAYFKDSAKPATYLVSLHSQCGARGVNFFKRVDPDDKETFRQGPTAFAPTGYSKDLGRVALVRQTGAGADVVEVVDAQGNTLFVLPKPGLLPKASLSPSGRLLLYGDAQTLVVRDLATGTEARGSLAAAKLSTKDGDPKQFSELTDDGTVVYRYQYVTNAVGQHIDGDKSVRTFKPENRP